MDTQIHIVMILVETYKFGWCLIAVWFLYIFINWQIQHPDEVWNEVWEHLSVPASPRCSQVFGRSWKVWSKAN